MHRFVCLCFVLFLPGLLAHGQDTYTVQAVAGTVTLQQKPVVKGQVIAASAPLAFGTGAKILVSSATHGRLVVQPGPQVRATETGISIQQYLSTTQALGTRGGGVFDKLRFANAFTLVGTAMQVDVPVAQYPLSDASFFFVRYRLAGDPNPVNKRLPHTGQRVLVDQTLIFTVDGNLREGTSVEGQMTLYYMRDAAMQAYEALNSFELLFADDTPLKQELPGLLELLDYKAQPTKDNHATLLRALEGLLPWQAKYHNLEDWLAAECSIAPAGE